MMSVICVSLSQSPTGKHKHSSGVPNSPCIQLYEWITELKIASVCQATTKTPVKQKYKQ